MAELCHRIFNSAIIVLLSFCALLGALIPVLLVKYISHLEIQLFRALEFWLVKPELSYRKDLQPVILLPTEKCWVHKLNLWNFKVCLEISEKHLAGTAIRESRHRVLMGANHPGKSLNLTRSINWRQRSPDTAEQRAPQRPTGCANKLLRRCSKPRGAGHCLREGRPCSILKEICCTVLAPIWQDTPSVHCGFKPLRAEQRLSAWN